jgi:hypothetical protein
MFDLLVKKKQHAVTSSPGTSLSAGTQRGTSRSHLESSSSKRKEKVCPSLPSAEVSTYVLVKGRNRASDTFSLMLLV